MGVKPIHVMSPAERTKLPEVTDFFIDLGMSKEEVENTSPWATPSPVNATWWKWGTA